MGDDGKDIHLPGTGDLPSGDQVSTSVTDWMIAHPLALASVVVAISLIVLWRSKYRPIMIVAMTVIATLWIVKMKGGA
jgi:hypothetical protein